MKNLKNRELDKCIEVIETIKVKLDDLMKMVEAGEYTIYNKYYISSISTDLKQQVSFLQNHNYNELNMVEPKTIALSSLDKTFLKKACIPESLIV